jgi:hypothetical protein
MVNVLVKILSAVSYQRALPNFSEKRFLNRQVIMTLKYWLICLVLVIVNREGQPYRN